MEFAHDTFLVDFPMRMEGSAPALPLVSDCFGGSCGRWYIIFKKCKTLTDEIKDIKGQVHDVSSKHDMYKINYIDGNMSSCLVMI
jgi:hypothetical protein